jgi:nitrogen regulatory protein P-II 1
MRFKIIVAMVKTDLTAKIVDAVKSAGGTGATIIPAHGTGIHEAKTFFGLTLDVPTDAIFFLKAICEVGQFRKPGTGIAFVLPVEQVVGLESQIEYFEKEREHLTETV